MVLVLRSSVDLKSDLDLQSVEMNGPKPGRPNPQHPKYFQNKVLGFQNTFM